MNKLSVSSQNMGLGSGIRDSEKNLVRIPDPRGQKGTRSRIRIITDWEDIFVIKIEGVNNWKANRW